MKHLMEEVLPSFSPKLFPHVSPSYWVKEPEYEHPAIMSVHAQIQAIHEAAREQVTKLESDIELVRTEKQYLHDLLTTHDETLVEAVKTALTVLGFKKITDADAELAKSEASGMRREDLQIFDISPTLLVEIKGKQGIPAENDALQVVKNISSRRKEWQRFDVRGLAIINHQRNLPALKRQNETPFQADVISTGEQHDIGFMTSWDLFRLVRSYEQNQWTHLNIQPLFYQNGRIKIVPVHYEFIGIIERFYPNHSALSIELQQGTLKVGDRIAFELAVTFEEEQVTSLRDNNNPVVEMSVGGFAGVSTRLTKEQAKAGVRVYRVKQEA